MSAKRPIDEANAIYWHYPHYANSGSTPTGAIRQGDWKLMEFFEDGHVELYNLAEDPAETNDLAKAEAERAATMQERLAAWRQSVGAKPALPNPQYDPAREKEGYGLAYMPVWDEADPFRARNQ